MHGHLICITRCLFSQSEISKEYWYEPYATSGYSINRIPSKNLNYTSPFSLLYNREPDLSYLRTFGSLCFPLIPKHASTKFDLTSSYCCVFGYSPSHKVYKCLRPKDSKIIISRHVKFFENVFPFKDYLIKKILVNQSYYQMSSGQKVFTDFSNYDHNHSHDYNTST